MSFNVEENACWNRYRRTFLPAAQFVKVDAEINDTRLLFSPIKSFVARTALMRDERTHGCMVTISDSVSITSPLIE